MKQIWKDVVDYQRIYMVSNFGRVKSLNWHKSGKQRIMKLQNHEGGYKSVTLNKKGQQKQVHAYVHDLVYEAFIRLLAPNEQIHHLDENPSNNMLTNLIAIDKSQHLREHKTGVPRSQQTKRKISEACKGRPGPNKGKKLSWETRRRISESRRRWLNGRRG